MPAVRRLSAILAADVAGYSRLFEADEEGTLSRLKALRAEVIDPRTLAPLDVNTIIESVQKTGRLVLVDQATRHASAAATIAAEIAEHGGNALKAPLKMVTALDTSIPYSEPLEKYVLPNEEKIIEAVESVVQSASSMTGKP